jgi:hypothetical protein
MTIQTRDTTSLTVSAGFIVLHSKTEIHAQTKTATVNLSLPRETLSATMCALQPADREISHNRVANRIEKKL